MMGTSDPRGTAMMQAADARIKAAELQARDQAAKLVTTYHGRAVLLNGGATSLGIASLAMLPVAPQISAPFAVGASFFSGAAYLNQLASSPSSITLFETAVTLGTALPYGNLARPPFRSAINGYLTGAAAGMSINAGANGAASLYLNTGTPVQ